MDIGHGGTHAAIALVHDEAEAACFCNDEVATGNTDIGIQEISAQHFASKRDHFRSVVGGFHVEFAHEDVTDFGFGLVDDGRDDVAGDFMVELDDVLTQVRFHNTDAAVFQNMVKADFLSQHALALDDRRGVVLLQNVLHMATGFVGIDRPEHLEAIGLQIGDQIIVPLDTCPIEQVQPLPTNTPLPGEETEEVNVEATAEVTSEATAEASEAGPTATITLAPTAENSEIEISGVIARGDVTAEGIGIVNRGRTVSLDGWTLSDLDGNEYVFQEYRLFSNAEVVVYTRSGQNTPSVLFWGLNESVWDADDVVTLRDADGDVQAILRISPDNVDLP